MIAERANEISEHTVRTADNNQFCAIAVGVEAEVPPRPFAVCDCPNYCAPNPLLRKAAARYMTFDLVRCEVIDNTLRMA